MWSACPGFLKETTHRFITTENGGGGPQEWEALRHDLRRRLSPAGAAQVDAMRRMADKVDRASRAFMGRYILANDDRARTIASKDAAREEAVRSALQNR